LPTFCRPNPRYRVWAIDSQTDSHTGVHLWVGKHSCGI